MSYHIALFSIPVHGHVSPTAALAEQLVARGHRVTFLTNSHWADAVRASGADVLEYDSTWDASPAQPEHITADDAAEMMLSFLLETAAPIPTAKEFFADDLPDLVVYDSVCYPAGRLLARYWQRPAVQVFLSFAANEQFSLATRMPADAPRIDPAHPAVVEAQMRLGGLLAGHGMAGPEAFREFVLAAEPLSLVLMPKSFQFAGDTFDDSFAFVGPCLGQRNEEEKWLPPADGRPVLLVSLGTTSNDRPDFFRTCLGALADLPWQVVASIGTRMDPAVLGELPSNVEVHRHLPQLEVLAAASLFISHAGMGSTMEAMHFGVPMVVVPQTPEQVLAASRVAELGLGEMVGRDEATAQRIREAVDRVAADDGIRSRVEAMSRDVRAAGGAPRAAELIEELLRGRAAEEPAAIPVHSASGG